MSDFTFIETDPKHHQGIKLDEYNGQISIVTGNEGDNGKVWLKWAFPQTRNKEPGPKAIPVKVVIGNSYQEAISNLKRLMADLGADSKDTGVYPKQPEQGAPEPSPPAQHEPQAGGFNDDIPF